MRSEGKLGVVPVAIGPNELPQGPNKAENHANGRNRR